METVIHIWLEVSVVSFVETWFHLPDSPWLVCLVIQISTSIFWDWWWVPHDPDNVITMELVLFNPPLPLSVCILNVIFPSCWIGQKIHKKKIHDQKKTWPHFYGEALTVDEVYEWIRIAQGRKRTRRKRKNKERRMQRRKVARKSVG